MAATANDPGERGGSRAARWLLAPPSCGDQLPARVPRAAPRRSSLRFPLSLPGSFASLAMVAPTASCAPAGPLPAIGLEHPVLPRGAALEDGALLGVDRKSVVKGKSVDLGGRRIIKKKKKKKGNKNEINENKKIRKTSKRRMKRKI